MKLHGFTILLILGTGLLGADPPTSQLLGAPGGQCCTTNHLAGHAFTDKSIYQLDSTWGTDKGTTMKLGMLEGRVQVIALFFARCQAACPVLVDDIKRIEAALPQNIR